MLSSRVVCNTAEQTASAAFYLYTAAARRTMLSAEFRAAVTDENRVCTPP